MEKLEDFRKKVFEYEEDLNEMIKENRGTRILCIGILISLIAIPAFYFSVAYRFCNCDKCSYWSLVISILLLIVSLVCFFIYKSIKQKQAKFQQEKILLRDLCIAIDLTKNLPPKRLKEEKNAESSKDHVFLKIGSDSDKPNEFHISSQALFQEKIIQTLLSRYPG